MTNGAAQAAPYSQQRDHVMSYPSQGPYQGHGSYGNSAISPYYNQGQQNFAQVREKHV